MANVTIRGIPSEILERLKSRANRNKRSLNEEIIQILDRYSRTQKMRYEELMEKARISRSRVNGTLSRAEIDKARKEGRA